MTTESTVITDGREQALASMRAALESTAGGSGAAFLLSGAAGMGKTHLARTFLDQLPGEAARLVGESPAMEFPALLPIFLALASDRREAIIDEISSTVKEYGAGAPSLTYALAPLLKMKLPRAARRGVVSEDVAPQEAHTFFALSEVLRRLGRKRRTVLFIDDVQRLDRSSLAFLDFLARQLANMPVLVLMSARTNGVEPPALSALRDMLTRAHGGVVANCHLAPLSPAEAVSVAGRFLGANLQCSEGEASWLQRTSKGMPKYLREVVELLRDRGSLELAGGAWRFACAPEGLVLPRSLREMTLERLKAAVEADLDAESLLNYAAICGTTFDARLIAGAARIAPQRAMSLLDRIARATGFVCRVERTTRWEFDHDLTREALLDDLGDLVPDLHRDVAGLLALDPTSSAVTVAHHYRAAGEWRLSAQGYQRAAEDAASRFAFEEATSAASICEQMLIQAGVEQGANERLEVTALLTRCLIGAMHYDRVAEYLGELHRGGLIAERPALIHALAHAKRRQLDPAANREAVTILREAVRRLGASGDPNAMIPLWSQLILACNAIGDHQGSQAAFRRALAMAQAAHAPRWNARLLRLTCMFWQPEMVIDATKEALALARTHKFYLEEAYCLNNLGSQRFYLRQFDEARENFESSRRLLISCGGYRKDVPTTNLGLIALAEQRFQDARALFRLALSGSMTAGDIMLVRINDAAALGMMGELDTARVALEDIVRQADTTGDDFLRDYARHNLARALLESDRAEAAITTITACPPRSWLTDDALILGKRANLLLAAYARLGIEPNPEWERWRAVLTQTTKPQAWLYRGPWEVCDLQFWQW